MDSIDERCLPLKEQYDTCFNSWYSEKFLQGSGTAVDDCAELFKVYHCCVSQVLEKRGFDVEQLEESVLGKDELKHLELPDDASSIVQREGAPSQGKVDEKVAS